MSKTKEIFNTIIVKKLQEKLNIKNKLAVPRLVKVVINVGTGKNKDNIKHKESVLENLTLITGQKPKITKARKAISGFKVRENDEVGMVVTLRDYRMYDFVYKLANIVLTRLRDFRGLDEKDFDVNGNYTIGIPEQIVFPEIAHEKQDIIHGMSVTIVTTAKNNHEGKILLETFGFPFKKGNNG